ncbi:IS607 family element RNA-guided endonuclease TnpB [Streptomyces capparidis]
MWVEQLRAFRFALDPTTSQVADFSRHAGAARWAFNHALAAKVEAHEQWRAEVAALVEQGFSEDEARRKVRVPIPTKPAIQKTLNRTKGDSRDGVDGVCPWWHEVSTYAFQSAFIDADTAWKNWLDSLTGKRSGRGVGYPRFKKKGRCRDAFRLYGTIRFAGYRRLRLPKIGEVRLHESAKRLARLIDRGQARIKAVTVVRGGHRWYASVLCEVTMEVPDLPTRRQRRRGPVGVDAGGHVPTALSKPLDPDVPASELVDAPRHLRRAVRRLERAYRALSRKQKGSVRREKARRRVARLHHELAVRRESALHQTTKRLATAFCVVAVKDPHPQAAAASTRGALKVGRRRGRRTAGPNPADPAASPGELRRQLGYKTVWYGSRLAVLDRGWPSSTTCSHCGWQSPRRTPDGGMFVCGNAGCGLRLDRGVNAARNIERHAPLVDRNVACDERETLNARGDLMSPGTLGGARQGSAKREDTGRPRLVPPQRSDPLALRHPGTGEATPPRPCRSK